MAQGNGTMTRTAEQAGLSRTQTLEDFVQQNMASLQQVASKSIDTARLARLILAQVSQNPTLRNCTTSSIFRAMQQAAECGLEPGNALGHSYLVPYKDEAQFIIGYRGFLELARRSGKISTLVAFPVYEGDVFDIELGADPKIIHKPDLDASHDVNKLRLVYAVARGTDGTLYPDVMTRADIDKIRSRSRSGDKGPWVTDYVEMARKTVVRRLAKYLPLSLEMAAAVAADEENDLGPLDVISATTIIPESRQMSAPAQPAIEAGPAKPKAADLHLEFKAKANAFGYEGKIPELVGKLLDYLPSRWTADVWQAALDKTETEWRAAISMLEPIRETPAAPEPAEEAESPPEDEEDSSPFDEEEQPGLGYADLPPITEESAPAVPVGGGAFN